MPAQNAESCAAHIRALIGDAIPFSFTLADIQDKVHDKRSRILSVHYHYPLRQKGPATPIAITARNHAGERKRLKLVS